MAAAQLLSCCGRYAHCSQYLSPVAIMCGSYGAGIFVLSLITAISTVLFPRLKLARNVSCVVRAGTQAAADMSARGLWMKLGGFIERRYQGNGNGKMHGFHLFGICDKRNTHVQYRNYASICICNIIYYYDIRYCIQYKVL